MSGARSAKKTSWAPLADRHVVILPDNDDEGEGYAKAVAEQCFEVGASDVRILRLPDCPPKGDVSDWLDAGRSIEELKELIGSLPDQNIRPARRSMFTATEIMEMQIPPEVWVVDGVLIEGLSLLAGKPKMGKSWLALGIAMAVAANQSALGELDVEAGEVLFIALEDGPRRIKIEWSGSLGTTKTPPQLVLRHQLGAPRRRRGGKAAGVAGKTPRYPACGDRHPGTCAYSKRAKE